jgi:nitrate/TMAO reductase-like tetraheme cytochrome c subunit
MDDAEPELGEVADAAPSPGVASPGIAESSAEAPAAPADAAPPAEPPEPTPAPRRRRPRFYLRGRRLRLPQSRGGLAALLMIASGIGLVAVFSTVSLIHWTETADFCGRCHTMEPELKAYHAGPHRDVSCGECHVAPGIDGWVKSKIAGTRQLVEVVLGTFPEPIPPPEHAGLPDAADTCQKCHDVDSEELADLRTRTAFSEDEANTRQFVGLMIRPGSGDVFDVDRGVHWHVVRHVDFYSPDAHKATIDLVEATTPDGAIEQYIAQDEITVADDVQPDIDAIKAAQTQTTMSCYDCHNRIGHSISNPRVGLDYELSTGGVDATLPYIKREGMRILWSSYPDAETADAEADKLVGFYEQHYPDIAATKGAQIAAAVDEIKILYRLTATPEMKVTAATYPDNMGHNDYPGCFRCHDGGHVLVEDGVALKKTIPSSCDTCHTFPQIGPAVASLPLGQPPSTHNDSLWVFNHRTVATDLDPGSQTCGECHARDYCVNCHATGAVTVDHDTMATNHAQVIRQQGNTACAYCHQPVYCARCHQEPVLPVTSPFLHPVDNGTVRPPEGLSWPLVPHS